MTTSAGRFKSTISKGSHRRSIDLLRPMATPSAVPRAIASTKDAATRASVAARLMKRAPDRASAPITDINASGAGSVPVEAKFEPNCHTRISNSSGASLKSRPLVFRGYHFRVLVECSLVDFRCVAGKVRASDFCKDPIKRARVGRFLGDRAARDAIYIGLPVEGEFCFPGDPDLLRDLLPIRTGMGENIFGLGSDLEKPREGGRMCSRVLFVEDIADHGDRTLGAEAAFHFAHADEPPEAARSERHAEIPKA